MRHRLFTPSGNRIRLIVKGRAGHDIVDLFHDARNAVAFDVVDVAYSVLSDELAFEREHGGSVASDDAGVSPVSLLNRKGIHENYARTD